MKKLTQPQPDYRLYILTRTDLPSLTPGKAAAHVGHACNAFVYENPSAENPSVMEWENQSPQGFGTTITLAASIDQIQYIGESKYTPGIIFGISTDPTYPYYVDKEIVTLIDSDVHTLPPEETDTGGFVCFRSEITAAYYFGDAEDAHFRSLVSDLSLLP